MLGFATGASSRGVAGKPILLLAGAEDGGAAGLEQAYDDLSPIKRFVAINHAAHNSFTDQCAIIWGGNNFLEKLVAAGFPIPADLLALAIDGCRPENLAPAEFWKVVQHFTVAHLRAAFGMDDPPVGLGDGIAGAFGDITLRYRHADDVNDTPDDVRSFVFSGLASIAPTFATDPCPGGFNLNPSQQVPPLVEDCNHPEATQDPLFKTVTAAGTIDGIDLDGMTSSAATPGACAHDDFTGPAGAPGVDFQYWRAVGCIRGFQPGEIADTVINQAVRDGSMTILLQVRGIDDPRNDDDVRVQVFASPDAPPVGADGSVLPFGTLSAESDPQFRSTVGNGKIVDGVLTAGPFDLKVRINIQIVAGDPDVPQGARAHGDPARRHGTGRVARIPARRGTVRHLRHQGRRGRRRRPRLYLLGPLRRAGVTGRRRLRGGERALHVAVGRLPFRRRARVHRALSSGCRAVRCPIESDGRCGWRSAPC